MAANIASFPLNNGQKILSIGMGTWMGRFDESAQLEAYETALNALKSGYRYFDTAAGYKTEAMVAKAIRDFGIPREEVIIQTKLPMFRHRSVRAAFEESLTALGSDYIDVYLMHWPVPLREDWTLDTETLEEYPFTKVWGDMEAILAAGKCKSIGVCNFSVMNFNILLKEAKVIPCLNQVEMHPYLPQVELKEFCDKKGIHLQAYTPLGQADSPIAKETVILEIAAKHKVAPQQVILAWGVGRGTSIVPKTSNLERAKMNITLPALTADEIKTITNIHLEDESKHRSLFFPGGKDAKLLGVMPRDLLGWDR